MSAGLQLPPLSTALIADTTLWREGLREGARQAHSFQSEMQGTFARVAEASTIGGLAGGAMGLVIEGLRTVKNLAVDAASAVGGLIMKSVKLAADYEMTASAFETMLGSAAKAKSMLDDLSTFATATPFEMTDLAAGSQKLLSFGVAAEQIMPTLRTLGDLALGDKQKFQDLVVIYGKGLGGKITNEDIIQIADKGIGIYDQLAKQLGVTKAKVMDLASTGKISISDIQRAFIALTGPGGTFDGGMDRGSRTLTGKISSLSDAWNTMLRNAGQAISENLNLKAGVDFVSNAVGEASKVIVPSVQAVAKWLNSMGVEGSNAAKIVRTGFEYLALAGAYVADYGVRPIVAGLYGMRAIAGNVMAFVIDQFAVLVIVAEKASQVLSKISGGRIMASSGVGQMLQQQAAEMRAAADAWWNKGVNTAGGLGSAVHTVTEWLEKLRKAAAGPQDLWHDLAKAAGAAVSGAGGKATLKVQDDSFTTIGGTLYSTIRKSVKEGFDSGLKDVKAWEKIMEDGRRVFDQTRTPLERLTIERNRLTELLGQGAIDQDTAQRAMMAAGDDYRKALSRGPAANVAAVERRTSFVFGGNGPDVRDPAKIAEQQLKELKESKEVQKDVARALNGFWKNVGVHGG